VVTFGCLAALLPALTRTSGVVKRLLLTAVALVCAFNLQNVALYLQQGWFQAASALQIVNAALLASGFVLISRMVVLPLFSLVPEQERVIRRGINTFSASYAIVSAGLHSCMIAEADGPRDAVYNVAAMASCFLLGVALTAFSAVVLYTTTKMVRVLRRVSYIDMHAVEKRVVLSKVVRMRRVLVCAFAPVAVVSTLVSVVHLSLGSFPFFFVFVGVQFSVFFPVSITVLSVASAKGDSALSRQSSSTDTALRGSLKRQRSAPTSLGAVT